MVDVLIRNLDEEAARRLKAKGASLSDTAREMLKTAVKPSKEEALGGG